MAIPKESQLLNDLTALSAYQKLQQDGSFSKLLPLVAMLRNVEAVAVSPASYAPGYTDGETASLPVDKLTGALLTYGRRLTAIHDTIAVVPKAYSAAESYTIPSATTETVILQANASRHWGNIENLSTSALFIKFGTGVSLTSFSIRIPANSYRELTLPYSGVITGIWETANGNAYATEVSG